VFSYLQNVTPNRHEADSLVCISELSNSNVYFDIGSFLIEKCVNTFSTSECVIKSLQNYIMLLLVDLTL
jgi:hypothetical protein